MNLVAADVCPFCLRCLIALEEKGVAYDVQWVELTEKASFLDRLSPYARVPVLNHDGADIYESSVICEYVDEVAPEPPLMPQSPAERADARFWIDFINTRFMPAYFNLLKSAPGSDRDQLRQTLLNHLDTLDAALSARTRDAAPFWMGQQPSLVDINAYPFFERFADVEEFRGIEIPARLSALHGWLAAMQERSSVRAFRRPRDFYVEFFRPYYAD